MKNIYFLFLVIAIISCKGRKTEGDANLSGNIFIDGSSTVFLLTEAIVNDFNRFYPNVKIDLEISGTGGGFKRFCTNQTDINNASRKINAVEQILCDSSGIEYFEFQVAYDGIALVVNKNNDWVDYLTTDELKLLWQAKSEKVIRYWSQVRKGWPDKPITLYGAGKESGTYDFFIEEILGKGNKCRKDYTASENDNILVEGIASDIGAIGYFGLAYYEENREKLKLVGLSSSKVTDSIQIIFPSIETISTGKYTPLSRALYIYVSKKSMHQKTVQQFVRFYLNHASEKSKVVGYVPLSNNEYEKVNNQFTNALTQLLH